MEDWLPKGERSRSAFIFLVLGLCFFLGLIRFFLVPALFHTDQSGVGDVLDETLGNVIATALAATALAWLFFKLFPPPARPAIVENVPAHEITKLLDSALPAARFWWFDGSTGRYQRSTTLPQMGHWARKEGVSRELTIVILDPLDAELCRRYARYREGLRSGQGREWSVDAVRSDIYATLLAAHVYCERAPLTVNVALKSTMSILRYDLCDRQLVITKEGTTDPAIACPAESFYYHAYLEDLRWRLKQARRVELATLAVPDGGFDRDTARRALHQMGLHTETLDDDARLDRILDESRST
jgi:hypothetical protein